MGRSHQGHEGCGIEQTYLVSWWPRHDEVSIEAEKELMNSGYVNDMRSLGINMGYMEHFNTAHLAQQHDPHPSSATEILRRFCTAKS